MSQKNHPHTFANRGLAAEYAIELVNNTYLQKHIAMVLKVPTEWRPLRNGGGKIVSAKVERKASVDYIGNAAGIPIAFDVKSVTNGTRWPLRNITNEQMGCLMVNERLGGVSFILLVFWETAVAYVIPLKYLKDKFAARRQGGKASLCDAELSILFEPLKTSDMDYLRRALSGFYRANPDSAASAYTDIAYQH